MYVLHACMYVCMYAMGMGPGDGCLGGGSIGGGLPAAGRGPYIYIYIYIFIFESIDPIWKLNAFTYFIAFNWGERLWKSTRAVSNWWFKRLRATAGQGPNYVGPSCGYVGLCWRMLAYLAGNVGPSYGYVGLC